MLYLDLPATLTLLTVHPLALLACTLRLLACLHVAGAGGYLIFRAVGFEWDALAWGYGVLCAVKRMRESVTGDVARREYVEAYAEVMEL